MSFEHPNRNNESMIDVERDIMSRPSERNTTNLDLQRMKMILDIMGHPEQSFRVIHITGTNGKGSTARMAEAICRAYGMRTGLYTSPHLEHVNERIAIDGQQLSDDDFVDTWDQIKCYRNLLAHPQEKINERALKMACETLLSEEFIRRIEGISLWLLSLPPAQQQELVDRLTS